MIRNNDEFTDAVICYRILKGRANLLISPYHFNEIPEEIHKALDIVQHMIARFLEEMWDYTDKIIVTFPFFRER